MVFKIWYQVMYRTGNEPIVFLFHQRFLFLWPLPTSKGTLKRVIQSCFAFFYNEADTFLNSCLNSLLLPLNLHPAIWFEKSRFVSNPKNLSGSDNPDFFQVGNLKKIWVSYHKSEKKTQVVTFGCLNLKLFSSSNPKNKLMASSKSFLRV